MTNSERDRNIEILKKLVLGMIEYIKIKDLFNDQTNQFVKDTSIILKESVSIDYIVSLWQKMKQIVSYYACGLFDNVFYYELEEKETGILNEELLTQIDELQIQELDCKDFYLLLQCFSRADCVSILNHVPSNNHAKLTTKGIEYILNQDYYSFEELMFDTNADIALPSTNLQKLALKNKNVFCRLFEFEIQNKLNEIKSIDTNKNTDLSNLDYPYPSFVSSILTADDEKCESAIVDDDLYLLLMDLQYFLKNFSEFGRNFLYDYFQELSIVVYQVELHNGLETSSPHDFFINFRQRCLNDYFEMSRSRLNLARSIKLPPIEDWAILGRNDDTEESDSESLSTVSKDEKVSVSEEKESSPISYIQDNNSDNYVRVLKSKINNPENQPENKILYECLERLFNYLLSGFEDIKLMPSIGKDTSKELFIYRFSGIRKNDQDINTDEKILWTGSGVLLGYIARCLFSSSTNPPMGITKFASFFKQESGKQFNLPASAKCEKIENKDDYETKRRIKQIHEEFVMAVELLRKCGFINAEYTSKRR